MERGHSLLELLVCAATLAIVNASALMGLASWRARHAVTETTLALKDLMERAYVIAISQRREVAVSFESPNIVRASSSGQPLFSLMTQPSVSIKPKSPDQQSIFCYPSHSCSPGTILITSPTTQCSLVVSLRGRMRSTCL